MVKDENEHGPLRKIVKTEEALLTLRNWLSGNFDQMESSSFVPTRYKYEQRIQTVDCSIKNENNENKMCLILSLLTEII